LLTARPDSNSSHVNVPANVSAKGAFLRSGYTENAKSEAIGTTTPLTSGAGWFWFTPAGGQVAQNIETIIFANSGNNYQPVLFDIPCSGCD